MGTYYCVWWEDQSYSPDDQLIGICKSMDDAESLADDTKTGGEGHVYITTETTNEKGECW